MNAELKICEAPYLLAAGRAPGYNHLIK